MSRIYEKLLRPALFNLQAETAHELGIEALRIGLSTAAAQKLAAKRFAVEPFGEVERFGLKFRNPIGIAAGFDKNGKVVNQLAAVGFGFVEVGTITYEPQPGNEKPRLFRLPQDRALINRLGFNNEGAVAVVERLKSIKPACILGVNIGKNKTVAIEEATENYLKSFELAHSIADYIAVNISSPNTPNLRELQQAENLEELLSALQRRNMELGLRPLLVKIAPDLEETDIESIVNICLKHHVAGIIATNTTVRRDGLRTPKIEGVSTGGLSGQPLANLSNRIIGSVYRHSKERLPIIGVGGIFTPEDAFQKIASGASLLQVYTGFVYQGISLARDLNLGLGAILKERGFATLDEAVGSAVKPAN
jgi:dihydroorotate dehydrogenase